MSEGASRVEPGAAAWLGANRWNAGALASQRPQEWAAITFCYLFAALALRAVTFGNPVHIDEQFYLLVGDRLLHGALPYVDIWDRKPIGLFLLYAGMRSLGGSGVIQYQIVAMLFAVATALVINLLARRIASPTAALLAGLLYLPYLSLFGCLGGQTPVFYNLPMALAVLALCRRTDAKRLLASGLVPMALTGLAIQIKYAVVFEGLALGLALLWRAHRAGWALPRLTAAALLWAGCALAPTLLALGFYAAAGHGGIFVQSNFVSIFQRDEPLHPALLRLVRWTLILSPLWLAILWAPGRDKDSRGADALPLLRWWGAAAIAGFLLFGTWLDHYVAPLLPPLLVLAAPALGWTGGRRYLTMLVALVGVIGAIANTIDQRSLFGSRAEIAYAGDAISRRLQGGCFYMFEGDDPVLYMTTRSCLMTRFVFPQHLTGSVETRALGVDQLAEARRVLARRPAMVMTGAGCPGCLENPAVLAMAAGVLARDYVMVETVRIGRRSYRLFQRRDLAHARLDRRA
jgi:hypothetical protein